VVGGYWWWWWWWWWCEEGEDRSHSFAAPARAHTHPYCSAPAASSSLHTHTHTHHIVVVVVVVVMEKCGRCGRSRLEKKKKERGGGGDDVVVQIPCGDADELHYACRCVTRDLRLRSGYQITQLLERSCCMHALARTLVEVKVDRYYDYNAACAATAHRCVVDEAKREAIDEAMSGACETCPFQGTPKGKCNGSCCPSNRGNNHCIRAVAGLCKDLGHPGLLFRSQYAKLEAIAACTEPLDDVDYPFIIDGPVWS